jgi:hypothetical protein
MAKEDWKSIWKQVQSELDSAGLDLDSLGIDLGKLGARLGKHVKVVCVSPDIQESVDEISRSHRDQVLMVRVDESTIRLLDAWVQTEAVKSRSEAAALFIREGLQVRESELEKLQDALAEVERAREKLQARVREVFGEGKADA